MGNTGIAALKIGIKFGYVLAALTLFIVLLSLVISAIQVSLNNTMLFDLLYFIQMWLPFNLAPLFTWLMAAVSAYFAFRLAVLGYNVIHKMLE